MKRCMKIPKFGVEARSEDELNEVVELSASSSS